MDFIDYTFVTVLVLYNNWKNHCSRSFFLSLSFSLLFFLLKYISVGIAKRTASGSAVWVISVAVIHHRLSQVHT